MDMFGKKRIGELEGKLAEAEWKLTKVNAENEARLRNMEAEGKTREGEYTQSIERADKHAAEAQAKYKLELKRLEEEYETRELQTGVVTSVPSKLNILLVEDKDKHLESVVEIEAAGHKVDIARDYTHAIKKLDERSEAGTPYDVVLSDMMFSYGCTELNPPIRGSKTTEEAALGYAVALYASQRGVKAVMIITDMNHHAGPVAATFDDFVKKQTGRGKERVAFNISGTSVVMYDCRDLESNVEFGNGSKPWINAVKILQERGYGRSSYPVWYAEKSSTGGEIVSGAIWTLSSGAGSR